MQKKFVTLMAVAAAGLSASSASAQFFNDGLDSLANWTVAGQPDTTANIIDYSALGIAEAPNQVLGSTATTGVQFTANTSAGAANAVNLLGAVNGGNADLTLSTYQVQFDMYLSVADPLPSGGTEQGLWGIARTTGTALGRNNRVADGDGVWGWVAVDNGYGTEDTAIFEGSTELADLGDTQTGESDPFNNAFTTNFGVNNAPGNSWVTVTITADNGLVEVWYNSVKFFSETVASTDGDVMVGYEDPFGGSISAAPALQFGIIDNVVIDDAITIPEPASLALLGLGSLAMLRRR